ncbi:hypothetical protein MBAV_001727, partial [Candidatus Magnetobacterium bavaricum]
MAYFFTNVQAMAAATTGAWTDFSLSALVPVGTNMAVIRVQPTDDQGVSYTYGLRAKGSADTRTGTIVGFQQCEYYCAVDSNRTIQYYKNNAGVTFRLVGYFTSDAVGLINVVTVTETTPAVWTTYDLSATLPIGTQFVCLQVHRPGGGAAVSIRCNDSTDDRIQSAATGSLYGYCVGVDSDRKIQLTGDNMSVYITGYITQGRRRVNGLNKSLTVTGSYQDVDVSADYPPFGYAGCVCETFSTTGTAYEFCFREKGSTDDYYTLRRNTIGAFSVGLDINKKFQLKISNLSLDTYVLGYFVKPSIRKDSITRDDIGEIRKNGFASKALTVQGDAMSGYPLTTQQSHIPVSS